jgi:predicted DNA-binding protein
MPKGLITNPIGRNQYVDATGQGSKELTAFRLDSKLLEKITEEALETNQTKTDVVESALEKYFTDDSDQEIDLGMLLQRLKERRPRSKVTFDDVKLIVELLG